MRASTASAVIRGAFLAVLAGTLIFCAARPLAEAEGIYTKMLGPIEILGQYGKSTTAVSVPVGGYAAAGDGGGGTFVWDSAATGTDDNGLIVNPTPPPSRSYDGAWSVKRFGAKGDNSADDTAGIQAALDALPSTGGDVYLPPGTYRITDDILIRKSNVRFFGAGPGATTLKVGTIWTTAPTASQSVPAMVNLIHSSNTAGNEGVAMNNIEISGIKFFGVRASGTSGEPKGISGLFANYVWIHDCHFEDIGHEVIWPAGDYIRKSAFWFITKNFFRRTGYSGTTAGAPSAITMNLDDSVAAENMFEDNYSAIGTSGRRISVVNNVINGIRQLGIGAGGDGVGSDIKIIGNSITTDATTAMVGLGTVGIRAFNDADNVTISNNSVRIRSVPGSQGSPRGIWLQGSKDGQISGNSILMDMNSQAIEVYGINISDNLASNLVDGNVVRCANEANTYHAAFLASAGAGVTMKNKVTGNRAIGFTRANSGYAFDLTRTSTGVHMLEAIENWSDGGYHRYDDVQYSSGIDNVPITFTSGEIRIGK